MNSTQLLNLIAQTFLKREGHYPHTLDGKWGHLSRAAAAEWNPAPRLSPDHLRALAAQTLLFDLGFYTGKLDGKWGRLSRTAAEKWVVATTTPDTRRDHPTWNTPYDVAKRYLGQKEIPGKDNNPVILRWLRTMAAWVTAETTAWCSAFLNFCASEAGYESSGSLTARSWLNVGEEVPLSEARKGDVVIFWRGTRDSWTGHVAFLDHYNPQRGLIYHLGGNQSDEVNITTSPVGKLLGVRRLRSLESLQGNSGNRIV